MSDEPNVWGMIARDGKPPFDLEKVAYDVASMMSCAAMPFEWSRERLEDGNGNEILVSDCLTAINSAPAMLLEIKALQQRCDQYQIVQANYDEMKLDRDSWKQRCEKAEAALTEVGAKWNEALNQRDSMQRVVEAAKTVNEGLLETAKYDIHKAQKLHEALAALEGGKDET